MLKKIRERNLHIVIIAFLLGLFVGINTSFTLSASEPTHKYLDYFHQVYQYIRTDYVETPKNKDVFYGAVRGMIKSLNDPFSRFLNEKSFREFKEDISGDFVGVGIKISMKDGEIIVISPIDGSPARKAGIMPGDIISKVDEISIKNKGLAEIVKLIRGRPGTEVKLHIKREGFDSFLEYDLKRALIHTKSVDYGIIDEHGIGYLRIRIFGDDTKREVVKALNHFNRKNIDRLVIDLRGNPGGKLDEAIHISDLFLEKGKVIVTTKGRKGTGSVKESKSLRDPLYRGKLIILVNKGSASASEILSGAVKDNNRGKLIGEKTFGKGSVQRLFALSDLIGITLTVAKYYTPSGRSIHGKGIRPDIPVSSRIIKDADKKGVNVIIRDKILSNFVKSNRLYNKKSIKAFGDLLKSKNISISDVSARYILMNEVNRYTERTLYNLEFDRQLNRAIAVLNGK